MTSLLVGVLALIWLGGAAIIWCLSAREVDTYGLEQSPSGLQGDPIFYVPALLTIPLAIAAGWALRRAATRWHWAVLATMCEVAVAGYVATFIVTLRFVGDWSPVGTWEIHFAWSVYGVTAALHLAATAVTAVAGRGRRTHLPEGQPCHLPRET